ncbi:hypothetical protein VTK26DRAFT_4988 [Humicola hyalothermophila]
MWLLESNLFEGRKLWLRPGKLYLFGRTAAEPGQLAISDKTISRKHITIQVDRVPEGGGRNLRSRSTVTIEDLNSKKGTLLNGVQIRGEKHTLTEDVNEIRLGMSKVLYIRWNPVVLSFSFTAKELRADPWSRLRDTLEQLDIKYSAEYETTTTHVVSKKRNTSKGLQALINGKYIVTDSFINSIVEAAETPGDNEDGTPSALEQNFESHWPNPIDHLPPRGEEPVERPIAAYSPDSRRQEVFDGYTFVFYDRKQYQNLFPAITAGKGKALLKEVKPGETGIDDFIRYVKGVAGEKGLGSFEDGSEGKGVVVVRFMPKDENHEWFDQFLTSFAQRLDHRPIDQREFLEAILACDASILRRPLEEMSQPESAPPAGQEAPGGSEDRMEIDRPAPEASRASQDVAIEQESAPATRRGRGRRAGRSRFKGFDFDDAEEPLEEPQPKEPPQAPEAAAASQDSLFVSQREELSLPSDKETRDAPSTRQIQRKRTLSPLPEHDNSAFMDEIAPTAAAVKRRRVEAGQDPVPPLPEPEPQPNEDEDMVPGSPPTKSKKGQAGKGKGKKIKQEEDDILELARRRREEAEAQAAAERQTHAEQADDEIDYAAIRRLHIIEDCEVHFPDKNANNRSRDQDIADGRWDPRWNGRKNFKRFRKQGDPVRRSAPQIILTLEEVKPKEYGIGDDYWLEDEGSGRRKKDSQREAQVHTQQDSLAGPDSGAKAREKEKEKQKPPMRRTVLALDSSDEEERGGSGITESTPHSEPSRSRAAKAAEKANSLRSQSQAQSQSQSQAASSSIKRTAAADPAKERAAKRPRRGFVAPSDDESDDSDDALKFRFGRRR